MRRHTGDVLLKSTVTGAPGVVITPTAFSSGHIGASMVNTTKVRKVIRINLKDYGVGERFYTYTLTGTEGSDFSRKVFVNGTGNNLDAGGPADYETMKASAIIIGEEIKVVLPPLSALYILVEPGTKQLAINNEITSSELIEAEEGITIRPNPSDGNITVENLPSGFARIAISDIRGTILLRKELVSDGSSIPLITGFEPGIYFITFSGDSYKVTKKLVIK